MTCLRRYLLGILPILAAPSGLSYVVMGPDVPGVASPVALTVSPDGGTLYVAEQTGKAVAVVDTARREVVRRIGLDQPAQGLTLSPDGRILYVTCGEAGGQVCRIDTATGRTVETASVGHTPLSPVLTPDGACLLVCNRYSNSVSVIALSGQTARVDIPVPREPVAVAVTPDGNLAVVANHLQAGRSDVPTVAAAVSLVDLQGRKKLVDIALPSGSSALRGVCTSPDGKYAYVTHVLARFELPTTQVDRGWMNTNAVSIIDLQARRWLTTVLLDDVDLGAANPWGIACSADGRWLCVCHSGTHELSLIALPALHQKILQNPDRNKISNDLSFLRGMRQRLPLSGRGPRAVAIHGSRVYVGLYFADAVDVVELGQPRGKLEATIRLRPQAAMTVERQGEMCFHDGDRCFQKWQSCASCHPDGYMDGLNWDLLNDRVGNPKNVKSLLLSHFTPPAMSSGVRPDAEAAVRAGVHHTQFVALDDADINAVDAWLRSRRPIPSPRLIDGQLSESAQRGKQIFASAGCTRCHSGPYLTDMQPHAVETGVGSEADRRWDVPTLINVWKTAPYLHDGRATTIREVITTENPHDRRGTTSTLTPQQIDDLVEYVLSL